MSNVIGLMWRNLDEVIIATLVSKRPSSIALWESLAKEAGLTWEEAQKMTYLAFKAALASKRNEVAA